MSGWSIGQLPLQALYQGPPDRCPEPRLCVICSEWCLSSSATTANVNTLALPKSVSVLLDMLPWAIPETARRCILIASTFKWSHHYGADVWCKSKAMDSPSTFSSG